MLKRLQFPKREGDHAQEQPAVAKARNIRVPVAACSIMDGYFDDLEILLRGAEDQMQVAERIEVAEVRAVTRDRLIVFPKHRLRAAQSIGEALADQVTEDACKKTVAEQIERLHGVLLHRIDEPGAVDHFAFSTSDGVIKLRQGFGGHCEIGVQDNDDFAARGGQRLSHSIALAPPVLPYHLDVVRFGINSLHPYAFFICTIAGIPLRKNDLLGMTKARHAHDSGLDIVALVSARNNDAHRVVGNARNSKRTDNKIVAQA